MKISEEKRQAVYNAIAETIMDLRVEIRMGNVGQEQIDGELFKLESTIWRKVKVALNIS